MDGLCARGQGISSRGDVDGNRSARSSAPTLLCIRGDSQRKYCRAEPRQRRSQCVFERVRGQADVSSHVIEWRVRYFLKISPCLTHQFSVAMLGPVCLSHFTTIETGSLLDDYRTRDPLCFRPVCRRSWLKRRLGRRAGPCIKRDRPLYKNAQGTLERRVNDLFGRLTEEEKLSLLGGTGFTTQPIPPPRSAPAGHGGCRSRGPRAADDSTKGPATAFPAGVAMASTWDTDLIERIGKVIGEEARNKGTGVQVLLGPAVNIHRSPLGGRECGILQRGPVSRSRDRRGLHPRSAEQRRFRLHQAFRLQQPSGPQNGQRVMDQRTLPRYICPPSKQV